MLKDFFELSYRRHLAHAGGVSIISNMKAALLRQPKQTLRVESRPDLKPGPNHVIVELKTAALNRRDYWITCGMYPDIRTPVVLGSDGAGTVSKTGVGVDPDWKGRKVIIQPGLDWGDNASKQSESYHILGMPMDGTFATQVQVPVGNLYRKPAGLDWNQSAALPLAGLTAYRALFTQGGIKKGMNILITGAGGGVSSLALQFSVAIGANVWVTSSSGSKIERAMQLGARGGENYNNENWFKSLADRAEAFDVIIDSAGGKGYHALIELAAPGGRIVNYGATAGNPKNIDMFKVFWKQLRIQGTTMGSAQDFKEMLTLVESRNIQPLVDKIYPLAEINQALDVMKHSPQFGKIIIHCQDGTSA